MTAIRTCFQVEVMVCAPSERLDEVLALLKPLSKASMDRISETRCASTISGIDLFQVRDALNTCLEVENPDEDPFEREEFW